MVMAEGESLVEVCLEEESLVGCRGAVPEEDGVGHLVVLDGELLVRQDPSLSSGKNTATAFSARV